ncbi:MAG: hypothetical protein STSR0008_14850 [Ignavibacterium sp.]
MKEIKYLKTSALYSLLFIIINVTIFVSYLGCHYSFTGASIPPNIKTIAIPFADDRTGIGEQNMRELLTNDLIKKFTDDNNLRIIDRNQADVILETVITSFNDEPAVVQAGENVSSRRITIGVQAVYRNLIEKKVIYDKQFSNSADYPADGGLSARDEAIADAIDKISEQILIDTVSGW